MRRKATISATGLLGQVIEPLGRHLNAEAANEILSLRAEDRASRRIEELAGKCAQGELMPEERAEYQLFVDVGDLVALLKAKARRYLVEHPAD